LLHATDQRLVTWISEGAKPARDGTLSFSSATLSDKTKAKLLRIDVLGATLPPTPEADYQVIVDGRVVGRFRTSLWNKALQAHHGNADAATEELHLTLEADSPLVRAILNKKQPIALLIKGPEGSEFSIRSVALTGVSLERVKQEDRKRRDAR
jgi:hypothetical protein